VLRAFCDTKHVVKDRDGKECYILEGPACPCACGSDLEFKILNPYYKMEVGTIVKGWSGAGREAFTESDTFCIDFPHGIDISTKATLLGN